MAESTVGWFGVREKYCLLADKSWLISQIRANEQTDDPADISLHFRMFCGHGHTRLVCWLVLG